METQNANATHNANTMIPLLTLQAISVHQYDLLIKTGVDMTMESISVAAMMRGVQEIEKIDMNQYDYPHGTRMKKRIYKLSQKHSICIQNLKLKYRSGIEVPIMDKYRIALEFGLTFMRKDLLEEERRLKKAKA